MNKFLPVFLTVFFLSACGVSVTQIPMPTKTLIPTATATLIPTATLTPAPTEVVMPDFMKAFIELGYDKQAIDSDTIYVVLDENATYYSQDLWGLKYKTSIIYSWTQVYYIENGILQKGFVLNDVCTEYESDDSGYYCFITWSSSGSSAPNPPQTTNFSRANMLWFHEQTVGDYPIVQIEFNSKNPIIPYVFQDIFPPFTGKFELIKIPEIGIVIPSNQLIPDTSEGKWINK